MIVLEIGVVLWRQYLSFRNFFQHYSGTTGPTEIQLCLLIQWKVCCGKYHQYNCCQNLTPLPFRRNVWQNPWDWDESVGWQIHLYCRNYFIINNSFPEIWSRKPVLSKVNNNLKTSFRRVLNLGHFTDFFFFDQAYSVILFIALFNVKLGSR